MRYMGPFAVVEMPDPMDWMESKQVDGVDLKALSVFAYGASPVFVPACNMGMFLINTPFDKLIDEGEVSEGTYGMALDPKKMQRDLDKFKKRCGKELRQLKKLGKVKVMWGFVNQPS